MSDVTQNTDVPGTETPTGTATVQSQTQSTGDSVPKKVFEDRVGGLTAQLGREKEQNAKLEDRLSQLEENNKTEQEKLVDAAVNERLASFKQQEHDPLQQRVDSMTESMETEFKQLNLTEEQRARIPDGMTIEQKLAVAHLIVEQAPTSKPTSVGGPVSPAPNPDEKMYTLTEFRSWQHMVSNPDPLVQAEWRKLKPVIEKAYREGRVAKE